MVVRAFGEQPRLEQLPDPEIGPQDVLLRVRACGVCHTDLKIRDGLVPDVRTPLVLGHEPVGEVVAVGAAVTKVTIGQRGIPYGYVTCGTCAACRAGRDSLCANLRLRYGFEEVGGYSEFLVVPERLFVPIPDNISYETAAVIGCSTVTSYHAIVKRARVRAGERVVIVGAGGGVGVNAVQIARLAGAYVIGVDVNDERLALAREQGAHAGLLSGPEGFAVGVAALTGGGADVVVEIVASARTLAESLASLRPGGRLALVGYHPKDRFEAATPALVFSEIEVIGCHYATIQDLGEVVDLVGRGQLRPFVSGTYPLEEAARALDDAAAGRVHGRAALII
jgi:D-arabinose 1-dehydrogenase-like Zn-dependent alcohol dehydrogenase